MNSKKKQSQSMVLRKRAIACYENRAFNQCVNLLQDITDPTVDDLNLLGISLKNIGENLEAFKIFEKASEKYPKDAVTANNLSVQALVLNQSNRAIEAADLALSLQSDYPEAFYNRGNALLSLGDLNKALDSYEFAVGLRPKYLKAWVNLGVIYQKLTQYDQALNCYTKALEIDSNCDKTHHNLANLYYEKGDLKSAVEHSMTAANIQPNCLENISTLFHFMRWACHWNQIDDVNRVLEQLLAQSLELNVSTEAPFFTLYRTADMELVRKVSQIELKSLSDIKPLEPKVINSQKIVIGYLSGDFNDHPVAQAIEPAFRLHNRENFEIIACSYGSIDSSTYCESIKSHADKWLDLRELSDYEAALKIQQSGVHILVDLAGHTRNNRIAIMAYRPAPVQCLYLGYPATSGADFIDYYLADRVVVPEEHTSHFSEKVEYLDSYYHLADENHPVGTPVSRVSQKLPKDSFVFCSFIASYKLTEQWFDLWLEILLNCDKSILWLGIGNPFAQKNLLDRASRKDLADRIFFADRVPSKADHLARLKLADLALDTPFFNGMTTTHDCLLAGIPVLTREGRSFPEMVCPGLMKYLDLEDLIAKDDQDFLKKACDLYANKENLKSLRLRCSSLQKSPVLQASRVVKDLEKVYSRLVVSTE